MSFQNMHLLYAYFLFMTQRYAMAMIVRANTRQPKAMRRAGRPRKSAPEFFLLTGEAEPESIPSIEYTPGYGSCRSDAWTPSRPDTV